MDPVFLQVSEGWVGGAVSMIGILGAAIVGLLSRFDSEENKRRAEQHNLDLAYERKRAETCEARCVILERKLAVCEDRYERLRSGKTPEPDQPREK